MSNSLGLSLSYNDQVIADNEVYIYDTNIPLEVNFSNSGKDRTAILTVYYDYQPVSFKVGSSDEYVYSYIFNIENGNSIHIPILLDENILKDENIHKLTICIQTGYNENAVDYENFSNFYGISLNYDIKYQENANENISTTTFDEEIFKPEKPDDIFYFETGINFMLNMDYENKTQKEENLIFFPDKLIKLESGDNLDLMYNIYNTNYENALFFICIDGEQTYIDNKPFKVIQLEPNALSNGKITIQVPEEKGLYDVTGYLIYDPFKKANIDNSTVYPSYRFTIEVL